MLDQNDSLELKKSHRISSENSIMGKLSSKFYSTYSTGILIIKKVC